MASKTVALVLIVGVAIAFLTIHHPDTPSTPNHFTSTFHKAHLSFTKHIHILKSLFSKMDDYALVLIFLLSTKIFNARLLKQCMHIPLQLRGRFLMPIKLTSTSF